METDKLVEVVPDAKVPLGLPLEITGGVVSGGGSEADVVRVKLVLWLKLPLVPVTVIVEFPIVADEEAESVRVTEHAGIAYSSMAFSFASTGGTTHSSPISGLADGGSYIIYVRCQDGSGNADLSDYVISFSVANTPPPPPPPPPTDTIAPNVSITSPANGAVVSRKSTITISASASDNVGVTKVEFYVNGALTCTDTAAPYACSWKAPNGKGARTISAKAYVAAGNVGTSSSVQVTIN